MDKQRLQQQVIQLLENDLAAAIRAAQTAHEAATHEENIAENKYDTLGLEAAYLATGQARRAEAIRQALVHWRLFCPQPYSASQGIQLGALVCLLGADEKQQQIFLGPEGGNMKLLIGAETIQVISTQAPLGKALLGKVEDVLTTEALTALYGAPVDVVRAGGRVFVVAEGGGAILQPHDCLGGHAHA